jgi:hypothetical protein
MSWLNNISSAGTTVPTDDYSTNAAALEIKLHGNWCGPGHGADGEPALDDLDTSCMAHDKGYGSRGYFDVMNDKLLASSVPGVILDPKSTWGERAAGMVAVGTFAIDTPVSSTASSLRPFWNFGSDVSDDGWGAAIKNFATTPINHANDLLHGVAAVAQQTVGEVDRFIDAVGDFFGGLF